MTDLLRDAAGPREYGEVPRPRPKYAISRQRLSDGLLYFIAYFSLLRATGMWPGYPPTQDENATIDSTPQQLMLYSLIPLTMVYVVLNWPSVAGYIRRIPIGIAAFCTLVLAATLMSVDLTASVRGLAAVVIISLPILLFKNRFGSVRTIAMLRKFALFAVLANLLYTAVLPRYGIMSGSLAGSVRGLFVHKNFFGQFSAVAFLLLLPSPALKPYLTYKNLLYAGGCFLALVSAAISKSSTALLLSLVGLMTLGALHIATGVPGRSIRTYLIYVSLLLLFGFAYFFGLSIAADIAGSFGKDITLSGRAELWDALWDALMERPWLGHGFAMFRQPDYVATFTRQIAWGPRSTHNTYLELALNIGIPGAILWMWILLTRFVGKAATAPRDPLERMANARDAAVMLMIMVGSLTEAGMMLAPLATWPLLLAAMPNKRTADAASGAAAKRAPALAPAGQQRPLRRFSGAR